MSDRPVTVKLGGTTIAEQQDVLREIADERRARPVVVVHGGGKRLTEWLERLGVKSHWNNGRRVTDEATLELLYAFEQITGKRHRHEETLRTSPRFVSSLSAALPAHPEYSPVPSASGSS